MTGLPSVRQLRPEPDLGPGTGAVGWSEKAHVHLPQSLHSLVHAVLRGGDEMGPSQDGVDGSSTRKSPDVAKRVHHPGMATTQEDYGAVSRIKKTCLIIDDGIGGGTGGVEVEITPRIFITRSSRHFARDPDTIGDLSGLFCPGQGWRVCPQKGFVERRRSADFPYGTVLLLREPPAQRAPMQEQRNVSGPPENIFESS